MIYDIDRFINEPISLNFNTEKEFGEFMGECSCRGIDVNPLIFEENIKEKAFVCGWSGGIKEPSIKIVLYGSDDFHVSKGWTSMQVSELIIENIFPQEEDLIDFLEV